MSELKPEDIRYLKLKNGEELIGYVTSDASSYEIDRPVMLMIVNLYEESRQLLNFREYLPPTIVKEQKLTVGKKEVFFMLEVQDQFKEQYIEMCEYLFDEVDKKKPVAKKDVGDDTAKVVSLAQALLEKKGKPIH